MNNPEHYDNTNGSLYLIAEQHGLNAWEFDIIKRIFRCRKKGNFIQDLEKTKFLIDLYMKEYKEHSLIEMGKEPLDKEWLNYNYDE